MAIAAASEHVSTRVVPVATRAAQLSPLTGLRFFAAMMVVCFHLYRSPLPPPLNTLVAHGFTGVGLFFVLSGFVLVYAYAPTGRALRGSARSFWLARVARLYPGYLAALAIGAYPFFSGYSCQATTQICALPGTTRTIGTVLTMTQGWLPYSDPGWDGPAWSLSAEVWFYLLFPYLAPLLVRAATGYLPLLAALAYTLCLAPALGYMALHPDGVAAARIWSEAYWYQAVIFGPPAHTGEFLLGLVAGMAFVRRRDLAAWRGWSAVSPAAAIAAIALLCVSAGWPDPPLRTGLLDPVFALLILSLAAGRGVVARALAHGRIVLLGEASYALYLLHMPLFYAITQLSGIAIDTALQSPAFFALYLPLLVASSMALHLGVEAPARRALRARWGLRAG